MEKQVLTTSNAFDTFIPSKIMYCYHELKSSSIEKINWEERSELEIWNELCFCVLSANVQYDLVKSVMEVMAKKDLFDPVWINNDPNASVKIEIQFNKPNFEPRKINGELRKYRYPKKRAEQIVQAARILYRDNNSIKKLLRESKSDIDIRNFFAEQIPGLGIKEASHFLRNIGYSDSLAIIDVHMLSFLRIHIFSEMNVIHLTKKMYLRIEQLLRNFVKYHGLNLAIFDLAVWNYMRSIR